MKEDYPGQEIIEYEYLGREKISDTQVEDHFRFEVTEDDKEKFVTIANTHHFQDNKLLSLTVKEEMKR